MRRASIPRRCRRLEASPLQPLRLAVVTLILGLFQSVGEFLPPPSPRITQMIALSSVRAGTRIAQGIEISQPLPPNGKLQGLLRRRDKGSCFATPLPRFTNCHKTARIFNDSARPSSPRSGSE